MALHQISELLGGKEILGANLKDRLDMVELGRRGISKAALANLAGHLSLTWRQIVKLLPVTERTLQRYKADQPLNLVVSEQILKIAELVSRGTDVFGNKEKFLSWLNQPCRSFSDHTPFSLLGSRYGLEMVFDELGRIEYGVYS